MRQLLLQEVIIRTGILSSILKTIRRYCEETGISYVPEPYPIWSLFIDYSEISKIYNLNKNFFNAGIFVIGDNLLEYNKISIWLYEKTIEYANILHLQDQSILNLMFQEFNLNVKPMDKKYNRYPTDKMSKNSIILHSYSSEKFWNFWNFKEWNTNYKTWINMGGSAYTGKKASLLSREVKKILPHAPDIVRKPRAFVLYLIEEHKRIQNSKKQIKE